MADSNQKGFETTSIENWTEENCKQFLTKIGEEIGVDYTNHTFSGIDGPSILAAIESTRELRDTFLCKTVSQRVAFENAVSRLQQKPDPFNTRGALYDQRFLDIVAPLYDKVMGVENMGPLLYTLVRFLKPVHICEVGAGYTSVFLLQALHDNQEEIEKLKSLHEQKQAMVKPGVPYCRDEYMSGKTAGLGTLYCIDNMAHEHTTANKVQEISTALNLDAHLKFIEQDAFEFAETASMDYSFDFIWIDLGAGDRIFEFFDNIYFSLKTGGYILVHSTLTNKIMRSWLETVRTSTTRVHETTSFLEPHKLFQNSFTLLQKRARYSEPVYTKYA